MPKTLEDFSVDEVDITNDRLVPNQFPSVTNLPYRIAIIGEAPGSNEVIEGKPFVGYSGKLLSGLLSRNNIVRDACFIGNVCQKRPPSNDISKFSRTGPEITDGLEELKKDLNRFQPNICLLLGKTALWAAKGTDAIGDWRGSLFLGTKEPFIGRKCIAAYHPAACLRQYEWTPLLSFDLRKAYNESTTKDFHVPERILAVDLSVEELLRQLDEIILRKPLISLDIEGGIGTMSCLSIAVLDSFSFIVPFAKMDGSSFYDIDTELLIWKRLIKILHDPAIPKVLQNSLYDRFVLQYSYHLIIRGVVDDTMLKHWELYCELEKSLGFQASIYTNEPFYKSDRKTDDRDTFFRYCCRDSAVTYEINSKLEKWLRGTSKGHYIFNVALLNPILYMENRGLRYDKTAAKHRLVEVNKLIYELQADLDHHANCGVSENVSPVLLLKQVQDAICYKRDPTQPKKGQEKDYQTAKHLLTTEPTSRQTRGFIATVCNSGLNTKGARFKKFLYDDLGLPKKYHAVTGELTTNYDALLRLSKQSSHPCLQLALDIGELRTRSQMLEISADTDGRIRCGYNVVGTETGRLTCYTSPTGSGYNLQTIPAENSLKPLNHPLRRGMRDLFLADEGCYLFQCDLSGADGWTVAAHLANLGDRTMLDDYLYGIKPAKVLCFMLRHGAASLSNKTREEVKQLTKEVQKESWDYFACKIGQHMTSYMGGKRKLKEVIFIQSEGAVNMFESDVGDLQRLFFIRYKVKLWWDYTQRFLSRQTYPPSLTSASGHTRKFFGRSAEIIGEALAHEPQANTTYATNLAAYKLWTDPDNRRRECDGTCKKTLPFPICECPQKTVLRIEPLHQVHDALVGQFRIEDTSWAVARIKSYFDNPLTIANQKIVIPFEGAYGLNWALDDKSKIGSI